MAGAPDRIAEIKAEFEKMLAALHDLEPPWRMPSEQNVLNKLRDFPKWRSSAPVGIVAHGYHRGCERGSQSNTSTGSQPTAPKTY